MRFTGEIDDLLDEAATRLSDSADDIAVVVVEDAQRWSLTHLRQQYVMQEKYLHAFMVDCMIRHEERVQEDLAAAPREARRMYYNGERLVPADPTILHEYMGSDL